MRKQPKSPYEVLGVKKDATAQELKRAYRRKAEKAHPDKGGDHDEMAEINRAYDVLGDPSRRLLYDQTGQEQRKPLDEEVKGVLIQAFADALAQDVPECLKHARQLVKAKLTDLQVQKTKALSDKQRLTTKREKVQVKSGENIFQLLIDKKLQQIEMDIALLEHLTVVFEAALKVLKNYNSSEEAKAVVTMYLSFGTASTGPAL